MKLHHGSVALAALTLMASAALAQTTGQVLPFDLPAQPLHQTLQAIAERAQLRLDTSGLPIPNRQIPALQGRMTPTQAFERALRDTGFVVQLGDAGHARLLPAPTSERITVTGTRDGASSYAVQRASTATKTSTPMMETPLTVEVLPPVILREKGGNTSLNEALNLLGVPSIGFEPTSESMYIRGFLTTTTLWNGLRIDDGGTNGGGAVGSVWMDNVDRLELLKGPASALYGRTEPGGVVNVMTRQPMPEAHRELGLRLGSWNDRWVGVDLSGPVNEDKSLLYRLNASDEQSGSWFDNGPRYRSRGIAPVLSWRFSPDTTFTVEGMLRRVEGLSVQSQVPTDPVTGRLLSIAPELTTMQGSSAAYDQRRLMFAAEHRINDDWTLSWKAMHLSAASPYARYAIPVYFYLDTLTGSSLMMDRFLWDQFDTRNRTDASQLDVTGEFEALGVHHTVLVGADAYNTRLSYSNAGACCHPTDFFHPAPLTRRDYFLATPAFDVDLNGEGYAFSGDYRFQNREVAVYAQDQMRFPNNWSVLAGLRYQRAREDSSSNGQVGDPLDAAPTYRKNILQPRFGAVWRPQPWLSLYYSYAENFGANTGFAYPNIPLKPETSKQHEIGAKSEWFDGKLMATLALFHLRKFNIATGDDDHPGFNRTIGRVRSTGYEFNLQGEPWPGWSVLFNHNYAAPYVEVGTTGSTTTYFANDIEAGTYLPVPQRTASLWTSYKIGGPTWQGLKVGGGVEWTSAAPPWNGSFTDASPSYTLVSAFASYQTLLAGQRAELQLNVNNLLDRVYWTGGFGDSYGSRTSLSWGQPRQVSLTLKLEI